MAVERDFELLDDYISNRLTGADKEAFEKTLERDPELKSEHQLQQKFVEGIRKARAAELKSMLGKVAIPPVHATQTLLVKVAASIIVVGAISAGIYFYLKQDESIGTLQNTETPLKTESDKVSETAEAIPQNSQPVVTEGEVVQEEKNVDHHSKSIAHQKVTHESKHQTELAERKNVVEPNPAASVPEETKNLDRQKPDVFDPANEGESNNAPENDALKTKAEGPKMVASTIEVKTDNTNKKYSFHYQFKNEQLFLYGSFEQNLYEIMEFFSGSKRTVFLFYKNNYYLLDEGDAKIKPLNAINDPVLQEKLKAYRGNN